MVEELCKKEWTDLCNSLRVPWESAESQWEEIRKSYSEPHRKYHTLDHIVECLDHLYLVPEMKDRDLLELSIWFHDIVHDIPEAVDGQNEIQSSKLCREFMNANGVSGDFIVHQAIISTCRHRPFDYGFSRYMVDIDLAVLGRPQESYREYSELIRAEYTGAGVSEEGFRKGRISFIESILKGDYVYSTPEFRQELEANAVENLEHELISLLE